MHITVCSIRVHCYTGLTACYRVLKKWWLLLQGAQEVVGPVTGCSRSGGHSTWRVRGRWRRPYSSTKRLRTTCPSSESTVTAAMSTRYCTAGLGANVVTFCMHVTYIHKHNMYRSVLKKSSFFFFFFYLHL